MAVDWNQLSYSFQSEVAMRADRVEVTWDKGRSNWLVRIAIGEEVIRRHCKIPKDSDEQTLRSAVQKAVQDEGYESDPTNINIHMEGQGGGHVGR
jgi:hypothetical protein